MCTPGWWGCKIACERGYFFIQVSGLPHLLGTSNIHLNRPFKVSLHSWRYCVVVEWDLAAKPSRAAKPQDIQPPRPYSLFLEHGSAATTLISPSHNTASYAGYLKWKLAVFFPPSAVSLCLTPPSIMIWWRAYVCKFMNRQKENSLENIRYVVWIGKTTWFHGRDTFVFSQGNVTKNSPIVVSVQLSESLGK